MVNIISAQALRDKFGPRSPVYTNIKRDLLILWEEVKDESELKVKFSYGLNTFKRIYDKPSLDLFIDHTYLIILTKIIVYLRLSKPDKNNLIELLNDSYFAKRGITNFLEEDFSEWLIHSKITDKSLILFSDLLEKATDYHFPGIDEDIFEWLYEEIVGQEDRHKLSEVSAELSSEVREYTPPDFSVETSYYYDKFKVGASIFPRSLYFVDFISCIAPEISVKTSEEIFKMVKDPWRVVLVGDIHEDFIYASLLAWEIIPFGYIKLHPVVLPIREHSDDYRLLEVGELQGIDFRGTAEWFKKAEEVWAERRTEKSRNRFQSLSDRLNYNNLLTSQNRFRRYVVLYNATGTNLVSCVVDRASVPHCEVDGQKVKPRGFIMDVKTWFFETDNESEAHYLCAVFNSETINELIKTLQPKGLFGARATHRRPLLFPIPEFRENENLHIELAEISKVCHEKIKIMKLPQKNNVRGEVRKGIRDEIEEINQVVAKLLKHNNYRREEEIKCQ